MAKMLKTTLTRGAIIWIAPIQQPVRLRPNVSDNPTYALSLNEPHARVNGASMIDRPPIELLLAMGIKVQDRGPAPRHYSAAQASRFARYKVIGCNYNEYAQEVMIERNLVIDPMVLQYLRQSNKITNNDLEPYMPLYDNFATGLCGILEGIGVVVPTEEGWIEI